MRSILLSAFLFLFFYTAKSQNLSYTCPRDTVLGCGVNCFTLSAKFPDTREVGNDYTFTNISYNSVCLPYTPPGAPGPSTNLTIDDRYSSVIPLPFPFKFYGTTYNSLVASANGYVSFDVSLADAFSHYQDRGNLPTASYDRALIMGPYHDLDPSETTSPNMQIKYQTIGTAPNRKWILSFYKVPLYHTGCTNLIENTHQIVLHEGSCIIEVTIEDMQICSTWQGGHAMVGLQDFTRTKGIMPPNRRMTDPAWGSIGMHETWRFIPTGGPSLWRSVELLDGSGTTLATGDTVRIDANTLSWNFPNVCPPGNTLTTYVIKNTYAQLNDPTQTMYSLDTVRVLKDALPIAATATSTTCGVALGSITVTTTGGTAPVTYVLNPGAISNTTGLFTNLAANTYTIVATDAGGCRNSITRTVFVVGSLTATATSTNASCPGVNNGSITVTPSTGLPPYNYSANGGPAQLSNIFSNLTPGTYVILFTDALGCTGTITRTIAPGAALTGTSSSVATSCAGAADGTITVTPTSGTSPFQFSLDGGAFQMSNIFTGVASGPHSIVIKDANGCTGTLSRTVTAGSSLVGAIYSTAESCPGALDGTVTLNPTNGLAPFQYRIDGGALQPSNIFTGLAAGLHTVVFYDANTCSGSRSINVGAGAAAGTSSTTTSTSCPGALDGSIRITPVAGAVYTLNPGGITNNTGIFTGLASGNYSATFVIPPAVCVGNVSPATIVVGSGPAITGLANTFATSCPTLNDGRITVTNPVTPGTIFTLMPGAITNNTGIFTGLSSGGYTISFVTAAGCTGSVSPAPVVAAGPYLTSTSTQVNPVCANINDGSISITPQASATAPFTVTLTGPGGPYTRSGNAPVTFINLAPGIYNYSFTSASGCTGTGGPVTLTSNPAIQLQALRTMPLCNGNTNGSIALNVTGGVAPYQYSGDGGGTYQATSTLSNLAAGTYNIRIRDNVNCTKDTTITLGQPTILTASAASTATAGCSNNDGAVTALAAGGTAPYTYTIAGPNVNTSGASTGIFTGLAAGTYVVTAKDANNCTTTANATVVLVDNMFLSLGADVTICTESSTTLNPQTNPETNIFTWTSLNAPPSSINNPALKTPTVSPVDTASYALLAQWGTCSRRDTITINVLHKPIANAGKDTAICNISYAILRGSASNLSGPVSYSWSPAINVQAATQQTTNVYPVGNDTTYTYTLTVTDNYGCNFSVTDAVNVRVQPPVPAFAGNDTIAVKGIPHQLYGSGGNTYLWSPSFPLNSSVNQNPLATLQNDTKFVLKVTDFAGCIGYDTVFIKVYVGPTYYVPNAFTPNGDGQNDVFRAIPVGIEKTDWFRIFNRFGETVFETNQFLKGWDGTYRGKKQQVGTYVWIIKGTDRNGKTVQMKGTVMLLQ